MPDPLENRFHHEMLGLYDRALKEAGYRATRFLAMVSEHGGLETARILIHAEGVSEGYARLWERGHPELTVEAFVFDHPEYHPLFTPEEHAIVRRRLVEYEYAPALKGGG